MIVINLQLQRVDMIYWNLLCKSNNVSLNMRGQRKLCDTKIIFRVEKKRFSPISPGINWDAVENTIIWKRAFFPVEFFSGLLILFYGVLKNQKPHWTFYNRPYCFLRFFVQNKASFRYHLWSWWEFCQKMRSSR